MRLVLHRHCLPPFEAGGVAGQPLHGELGGVELHCSSCRTSGREKEARLLGQETTDNYLIIYHHGWAVAGLLGQLLARFPPISKRQNVAAGVAADAADVQTRWSIVRLLWDYRPQG